MNTFKEKLLKHFNLSEEEFLALTKEPVTVDLLPGFTKFNDIDRILERIKKAIENKEKIAIYGDYDCDGVMATTILYKAFLDLNYSLIYPFLPSRYIDGYGLTSDYVKKAAKKGISLIITVDNGVSANDAIDLANSLGIDVIVTDHHEVIHELPKAYAFMHPFISEYGEITCCGAYVSFMLASALLGKYDEYLLTLAAIATISDVMPLKQYNRDIVRIALNILENNSYLALTKLAGTTLIDEEVIAMRIAPKINAIGRMAENHELNVLLEYLTTSDKRRINAIYEYIEKVNEIRKETMNIAFSENDEINESEDAIVVLTSESEGLIGLLATRFLKTYDKVAIVFCKDSKDPTLLRGSARSKKGFNVSKAFKELSHLPESYGGHAFAGGCSLKVTNYLEFKEEFIKLAKVYTLLESKKKTIALDKEEFTFENYALYRSLAPYGEGFKKPYFKLSNIRKEELVYSRDGKHILTPLGSSRKLIGFNKADDINLKEDSSLDFIGTLSFNEYRGWKTLQFMIEDIE